MSSHAAMPHMEVRSSKTKQASGDIASMVQQSESERHDGLSAQSLISFSFELPIPAHTSTRTKGSFRCLRNPLQSSSRGDTRPTELGS